MAEIARGNTTDRPFVRTIYTIAAKRFTGDFTLEHDGAVTKLAWHRGFVVAADVPGASGSLGERACATFGLGEASFVLDDASTLDSNPEDQPVDARWLIFHGILAHYDDDRLARDTAVLAGRSIQLKPTALPNLEHFGLEPADDAAVKQMMAEPSTVEALIATSGDERRIRALVYALLATDSLTVAGDAKPRAKPRAATPRPKPPKPAVGIDPGNAPVTNAQDLRSLVSDKVQLMQRKANHFEMLGVPTSASGAKIRGVYFELAKSLHPDRVAQLNLGALAGPASQVFARLNEAFSVLGDDRNRRQYLQDLEAGRGKKAAAVSEADMLRLLEAEEKFKLGEMALRRSHFHQALEDFEKAVELNPDEGEHHAMAAYARFMDARDKQSVVAEVKRQFRTALRLSPQNPNCIYYRGKVAKELHDYPAAMYCFDRALELDDKHEPAFREKNFLEERIAHEQGAHRAKRTSRFGRKR